MDQRERDLSGGADADLSNRERLLPRVRDKRDDRWSPAKRFWNGVPAA